MYVSHITTGNPFISPKTASLATEQYRVIRTCVLKANVSSITLKFIVEQVSRLFPQI